MRSFLQRNGDLAIHAASREQRGS